MSILPAHIFKNMSDDDRAMLLWHMDAERDLGRLEGEAYGIQLVRWIRDNSPKPDYPPRS